MIKATAFYPEYFSAQIEENYQKIKAGGIDAVRFGEFAWGHIEPEEGRFNFEVFDRAFALAAAYDLQIILCTPTACPPAWLVHAHPDILPVNDAGQTIGFGARQHRCYNAPAMTAAAERVNSALAARYGKHPALLAWQIDNELGAEHKYCYCDTCRTLFQGFLNDKYRQIDALNERMFTTFWAQNFTDFSQIPLPMRLDAYLPMRPHPGLMYEFLRFSSDSVIGFAHRQAATLRQFSDRPITTNQDDFYYGDNVDWYKLYADLDFVSYDIYTERLYEIGFYNDLARCAKQGKPFWQMEFSACSPILTAALDLHVQKGGEGFGLFAFNPFPAGQEQGTHGLVDSFGHPEANYALFRDWQPVGRQGGSANVRSTGEMAAKTATETPKEAPKETAKETAKETTKEATAKAAAHTKKARLLYDFESAWAYNAAEYHTWEMGYAQIFSRLVYKDYLIHTVYKALFENGYDVDVTDKINGSAANNATINTTASTTGDTMTNTTTNATTDTDTPLILLLPRLIIHNPETAENLLAFIAKGGRVIATDDLFNKNADSAYHRELPAFFIRLGCTAGYPKPGARMAYGNGEILFLDRKTDENGWAAALTDL